MRKRTIRKIENSRLVRDTAFSRVMKNVANFFSRIFHILDSKLTIMVVPHSGKKVVNFQTNIFALALGAVLIVGVAASFFYFNNKSLGETAEISRLMSENRDTLASLDELRDENVNLLQTAKRFRNSLSRTLSLLGLEQSTNTIGNLGSNSDLASLFNIQDKVNGTVFESAEIKELDSYLSGAVEPIEQIGKMLENQNNLFKEIPSIWPTSNPNAHLSFAFGPNIHPLTGQWYIHKGLDFSTYRSGDPVIATADGQVVSVGFDASYGNNVIIRHKHGTYTRYAHMSRAIVTRGQVVEQKTVIGYIGNTGITTAPHLHYEVHIGSDVVDPAKYINVKFSN